MRFRDGFETPALDRIKAKYSRSVFLVIIIKHQTYVNFPNFFPPQSIGRLGLELLAERCIE